MAKKASCSADHKELRYPRSCACGFTPKRQWGESVRDILCQGKGCKNLVSWPPGASLDEVMALLTNSGWTKSRMGYFFCSGKCLASINGGPLHTQKRMAAIKKERGHA